MSEMERLLREAVGRLPGSDPEAARLGGRAAREGLLGERFDRDGLGERAAREGLLDVAYASTDTPLGRLLLAATPSGLVRVAFPELDPDRVLTDLSARISPRILEAPARLDPVRRELDEYFEGRRRWFTVPVDLRLTTPFGRRILDATAALPFGAVSTYGSIAAAAGSPRGVRAAGGALGANPVCIVVPCHRVVRSGGGLSGYAGGPERKAWLLRHEEARIEDGRVLV